MEQLDFAGHYIESKKKLENIYRLLNKREFASAATLIDETIVELRLMRNAVKTHIGGDDA